MCGARKPAPPPEKKKPALTLKLELWSECYLILQGDGTKIGHTHLSRSQVMTEFPGETVSDQITAMMEDPRNWVPV